MKNLSPYPLTLFIDSECALCRAEEVNLQRLDSEQRLQFVDISSSHAPAWELGELIIFYG